jgi:hypothetical protein
MKNGKTDSAVDKLRAALREMASEQPQRQKSMFENVKEVLPEIRDLKSKRFTDNEILTRLGANGIEMSLGTFRQYVNRAAREATGSSTQTRQKRKVEPKASADLTEKPKPSEIAKKPALTATESKAAFGHKLDDDV